MNNLSELFGIIGPNGPEAADFWAPIFEHSHLPTVSIIKIIGHVCMEIEGLQLADTL
jgi:hypothetical protein